MHCSLPPDDIGSALWRNPGISPLLRVFLSPPSLSTVHVTLLVTLTFLFCVPQNSNPCETESESSISFAIPTASVCV